MHACTRLLRHAPVSLQLLDELHLLAFGGQASLLAQLLEACVRQGVKVILLITATGGAPTQAQRQGSLLLRTAISCCAAYVPGLELRG